jgi:hypothetical protein
MGEPCCADASAWPTMLEVRNASPVTTPAAADLMIGALTSATSLRYQFQPERGRLS